MSPRSVQEATYEETAGWRGVVVWRHGRYLDFGDAHSTIAAEIWAKIVEGERDQRRLYYAARDALVRLRRQEACGRASLGSRHDGRSRRARRGHVDGRSA
jgi:hypothetical protein